MKVNIYFLFFSFVLLIMSGCQTFNQAVEGPSNTVGSVLGAPQVVTQGINSGYVDQTGAEQSNPYGR